jgi:negative regulator of replication initiation
MAESALATIQRQQIEIAVGELLLTDDFYMRQSVIERIRHLIAHADTSLDISQFSEATLEELQELHLLPPTLPQK